MAELTCPLGSKCREIKNDTEYQCAWYIQLRGKDIQGKEHDEYGCAIAWLPILQLEVAGTNRGQTQAIESLRNETIQRQTLALQMLNESKGALPHG